MISQAFDFNVIFPVAQRGMDLPKDCSFTISVQNITVAYVGPMVWGGSRKDMIKRLRKTDQPWLCSLERFGFFKPPPDLRRMCTDYFVNRK